MDANEADIAIKVIERQNQHGENLCQQLQDAWAERDQARAWAAAWKAAAKSNRVKFLWFKGRYNQMKIIEDLYQREQIRILSELVVTRDELKGADNE